MSQFPGFDRGPLFEIVWNFQSISLLGSPFNAMASLAVSNCGHGLRSKFYLYDDLVNLNHGSFGTVPKVVMDEQIEFLKKQESCPELWFRGVYESYVDTSLRAIAPFIGASELGDVVMVENASYAVNSVLRSFSFTVSSLSQFALA